MSECGGPGALAESQSSEFRCTDTTCEPRSLALFKTTINDMAAEILTGLDASEGAGDRRLWTP
jgi:hypothetical protein